MPEAKAVLPRLDEQCRGERLSEGCLGLPSADLRNPGEEALAGRHADDGGCTNESLCPRSELPKPLEDRVSHGRRDGEVLEGAADPHALASDQILPVLEQPEHLLDGEREAATPLEQVIGKFIGDRLRVEDRSGERPYLLPVERAERQLEVDDLARESRAQRGERGGCGQLLAAVRADERQLGRELRAEVTQELRGLLVRPMQILEHENAAAERAQKLA